MYTHNTHLSFSHIHMCTPEPPHINSWGPIVPLVITVQLRVFWPLGVVLKTLIHCPSGGAFPGHCPASRWYIIGGQWMIFALYVSVWLTVSHWKRASWQLLAAPGESLCENFLRPENQTHCVIVAHVWHNLLHAIHAYFSHKKIIYFSGAYLES